VTGFATDPITDASGTVVDVFSQPVYHATISDPDESLEVEGEALLSFTELNLDGICIATQCHFRLAGFDEFFLTSSQCEPDPNNQGDENPGCQFNQGP